MVKKIAIFLIKKMLAYPAISPFFGRFSIFVDDSASFQLDLEDAKNKLPKSAHFRLKIKKIKCLYPISFLRGFFIPSSFLHFFLALYTQ